MLLDLKLEHKLEMLCDEAALASIFRWLKRRYEMIFSEFWKFKLAAEDPRCPGVIGRRIVVENGDIIQLAAQYHGIQITYHNITNPADVLNIAARELAAGFPIAVMFHDDFLPFLTENQREGYFPVVVVGMDDHQGFYCLEIHSLKKTVLIPREDFLKGYFGCATFAIVGGDAQNIDYREIITHNTGYLLENNAFDSMRDLSRLIGNLDYAIECNGETNAPLIEISQKLKMLYRSRYLFSFTLAYLVDHKAGVLAEYPERFLELSTQWLSTWGLLTMAFRQKEFNFQRDFRSQMGRVGHKVFTLAGQEEELCNLLVKTLHAN